MGAGCPASWPTSRCSSRPAPERWKSPSPAAPGPTPPASSLAPAGGLPPATPPTASPPAGGDATAGAPPAQNGVGGPTQVVNGAQAIGHGVATTAKGIGQTVVQGADV